MTNEFTPTWTTLRLRLPSDPVELSQLRSWNLDLEALGGVLTGMDEVDGVEHRDSGTFDAAERPELWVYTRPAHVEVVRSAAERGSDAHGLPTTIQVAHHDDESWRDGWKAYYKPFRLGELLVRPSWIPGEPGDPPTVVLDPGRAFGTGMHETTRLCLELLAQIDPDRAPHRVLDFGCGSGILGLAVARRFPQARILAIDVDPEAVDVTVENAAINGLQDRVEARVGTAEDLGGDPFDLVLANVRPSVLVPAAGRLARLTGRQLILSGILVEERDEVIAAYKDLGLNLESCRVDGEWTAPCYLRQP